MTPLLDTNIISELTKPRPSAGVIAWVDQLDRVLLSAITLDEILFGLTRTPNMRIERWFESFLDRSCLVLDVTVAIARHAGLLRGQLAARGKARSQPDMLIAATATIHGLTLATRNVRDFDGCGISVVNPFA